MKIGVSFGSMSGLVVTVLGIAFLLGGRAALGSTVLVPGIVLAVVSIVLRLRYNRLWLERAITEDEAASAAAADR